MRKIKRLLSLAIGFVGCMLAGVFALQTPKAKPQTVTAATTYTSITKMFFHTTGGGAESFYMIFGSDTADSLSFATNGVFCNLTGREAWYAYSQAMNNFASQITLKRGETTYNLNDVCILTVESATFNIGCWGNVGGFTLAEGDVITIPQGATYEYDENGDGVVDYAYKFAKEFRIERNSSACSATLGCNASTLGHTSACRSGYWHGYTFTHATETAVGNTALFRGAGSDKGMYLRFGEHPYLSLTDGNTTNEPTTDRNSEDIADWAKQMIFATSEDGINFTYHNYYEYVLDLYPDSFAIQLQDSINVYFHGFQNDWDTLIIPQGTTLRWDYNGDGILDYHWVFSKTVSIVRWVGSATAHDAYNCSEFRNATGLICHDNEANGTHQGYFHLFNPDQATAVGTITSQTVTANTVIVSINGTKLFPAEYAIDTSTWTYNGTAFSDVCNVAVENGYVTITKKEGTFANADKIVIPAGAVITNTITGDTYNFTTQRTLSLYNIRGNWYLTEAYYEITSIASANLNVAAGDATGATATGLYVYFLDSTGATPNVGYNLSAGDGNTGGWYAEDANTLALRNSVICSASLATVQICGQPNAFFFNNGTAGQLAGASLTIPQGTVYYSDAKYDSNITTQVLWYFPYTISLTMTGINTYTQGTSAVIPEAPVTTGNNVFVGYKLVSKTDGSVVAKLYQPGEAYDHTAYTCEAVTLEMYMEAGASARLSEVDGICGIRYTVNVNKTQIQSIKDTFGVTVNLGLRIRVVNSEGKISKTESTFTAITDALGTAQTGNCRESGEYLVYTVAYVMHDEFINLEINNSYSWLGDGFITLTNTDATTATYYAVQNDNVRSYRWLLNYYLNVSWTAEQTEVNQYKIEHTLSDGTIQVRYYSFYFPTYQVLLSEATRARVTVLDAKE